MNSHDEVLDPDDEGSLVVATSVVPSHTDGELRMLCDLARKNPREITTFLREARSLVTLNESVASACIYALRRGSKTIEGPSARFAEIIVYAWGNCQAGARIVGQDDEFVTARGMFRDLQKLVEIQFDVPRRITDSNGQRYSTDMIGVTSNAAASIALRNAVLKGVPKAFWDHLYHEARKIVAGDATTLSNKRLAAIQAFAIFGVSQDQILAKLGRAGIADVSIEDLVLLAGFQTAIKEGQPAEDVFGEEQEGDVKAKKKPAGPQRKGKGKDDPTTNGAGNDVGSSNRPSPDPLSSGALGTKPAPTPDKPPAPKGAPAPAQGATTQTRADPDEREFLVKKLASAGLTLDEAMLACGITQFDQLTADGYLAMREWIRDQERLRG